MTSYSQANHSFSESDKIQGTRDIINNPELAEFVAAVNLDDNDEDTLKLSNI